MLINWLDSLGPNHRTLAVSLIIISLATLPLYGIGAWLLTSQNQAAQARALDSISINEAIAPADDETDDAPSAAGTQLTEPVAPIRQQMPPASSRAAPAPAAQPAPPRVQEPPKRAGARDEKDDDKHKNGRDDKERGRGR